MINKISKIFKGNVYCDEKGLIFEAYNIANIDSIYESSKVISHYTNLTFKYSNPSFFKLINEFILLKSILGSIVRNFIIKNLKNPFNIIKEGLQMDYFNFRKINK